MKFKNIVLSGLSRTKKYETVIDIKTLIAPVRSKRKKETGNIIVIANGSKGTRITKTTHGIITFLQYSFKLYGYTFFRSRLHRS